MKQNLFNKLWLRVGMIVAIMTTALAGTVKADDIVVTLDNIGQGLGTTANTTAATTDITATGTTDSYTLNYYQCKKQTSGTNFAMFMTKSVDAYISNNTAMPGNIKSVEVFIMSGAAGKTTYDCAFSTTECNSAVAGIGAVNITGGNSHTFTNSSAQGKYFCITLGNANNGQVLKLVITCESATPATPYTVTLGDNGSTLTEASAGAGVALPSRSNVGSYTFAGWSDTNVATETTTAPTTIIAAGTYHPTSDITLYPVYAKGTSSNETASVTISDYATTNNWVSGSNSGPQYTEVVLNSDIKATTTGTGNNGKYYSDWRFYQNGNGNVVISTTSGELTSVTFTFTNSNTGTLNYNSSAITSGIAVNVSGTSATFTLGNSGSATNGQIRITAITVNYRIGNTYYTSTPSGQEKAATPTFSPAAGTYTSTQNVTLSCETSGATIYYTIDGNDPTTSSSVYSSAIPVSSTTTVKAMAAATGYDNSSIASATYTIFPVNHAGTQDDPYTVADARNAIDANTGVTGVYAKGKVSAIVEAYNSTYHNISYNISADGLTTSDQLEIYRGKSFNGDNFTSENDIQVGDEVVVYGDLTKFNSTYEFAQDNQLVSLDRPVVTTPTITVNTSSVAAPYAGQDGTITVTYNNITTVVAEVFFCDVDGNAATYDWVTASINNLNNVEYIIDANASTSARTAYMKVYALDDDANDVYSELITVTQDAYVPSPTNDNYIRISSLDKLKDGSIVVIAARHNTTTNSYYAMENTTSGKPTGALFTSTTLNGNEILPSEIVSNEDQYYWVVNVTSNGYTFTNANGDKIGYTSSTNFVSNGNNTEWTIESGKSSSTSMVENYNGFVIKNKNNTGRAFALNESHNYGPYATSNFTGDGAYKYNFYLDFFVQMPVVTLNAYGYATFASTSALDFTDAELNGYSAWAITAISGENITFTQVTGAVPAGTGVLLKGTASTPVVLTTTTGATTAVNGNKLVGITSATDVTAGQYYGLSGNTFVKVNAGTVPAGKALLPASVVEGSGVKAFTFVFEEDDATAIEMVNGQSSMVNGPIYNIAGQRISKMQKGINIVNGKKILK